MSHQLVGFLACCIEAHRRVGLVGFRERSLRVQAIDRTRRRKQQVLNGIVATSLKNVQETGEVAIQVCVWVAYRVAHTGLSCKIDNLVKSLVGKQPVYSFLVGKVHAHEPKSWKAGALILCFPQSITIDVYAQLGKSSILQPWVIVAVDVVNAYNLVAPLGKHESNLRADKSGCAGN